LSKFSLRCPGENLYRRNIESANGVMALNIDGLASSAVSSRPARRNTTVKPAYAQSWVSNGLASALDQLGIVSIADADGRILHVNDEFVRVSKYPRHEVLGQTHAILNSARHSSDFWSEAYHVLAAGRTWQGSLTNRAKDGTFYWVDALIVPLKSRNRIKGYLSIQRDITEAVSLRAAVEGRDDVLHAIAESFPGGVAAFDKSHRLIFCNDKLKQIFDYPDDLFDSGQPTLEQLYCFNANRGEYGPGLAEDLAKSRIQIEKGSIEQAIERRRPDGTYLEIRCTPLPNGGFVIAYFDITARTHDQAMIARLAHHDVLTGLSNRAFVQDRIHTALTTPEEQVLALHCLNIDGFKTVNETLGRAGGDQLLKLTAQRLGSVLGRSDIAARLGADDFAVMQMTPRSIEDVEAMAKRIIETLSEPFVIGDHEVAIGTSVGIALAPSDGTDAEQLMQNADTALWRMKSQSRGTFGFFEPPMRERLNRRLRISAELREAIANNRFELHYQPIVNIKTRRIVGCEALIRWSHPEHGLIPASEFIPIAEECGLIGQIGDWVLKAACAEARQWPDDIWIAVNISAAQFNARNLVDKVVRFSKGLPLSRLVLEITETLLMKDRDVAALTLGQLKKLGVRFAIDDFGTGFSSLSYLQSFPFDKVKIDRSFVSNTSNQKRSSTLRRSIIQLGYNLAMTSVAEGVETPQQLDLLRAEGCVEAQGFLFSPAVPAESVRELFSRSL
jgi:diguanylate cyclase (GGDEF)-like protein/PAS domain S-box-containing protein